MAVFCYSSNIAVAQSAKSTIEQLSAEFESGRISRFENLYYQVLAVRNPSGLPSRYQVDVQPSGTPLQHCASEIMRAAFLALDELNASQGAALRSSLARPSATDTYESPGGYFKLHYDIAGTHSVPTADLDEDGVPDFIESLAAIADTSWETQIEQLGYLRPPSDGTAGGDSLYDVYFQDLAFFGFAQPESLGPEPWNDFTSYLVCHRNFSIFSPNDDPEGKEMGAAKATMAHELRHAIQFAYDGGEEAWYMESDATWIEEIVFDIVNDNYRYLPHFYVRPQTALTSNSFATEHPYSAFIWQLYLSQKFDQILMRRVWEGARYAPEVMDVLSDSLLLGFGWDRDSAFVDFVLWSYLTAGRDDGLHFEEAGAYPSMTIGRTHTTYPVPQETSNVNPAGYASSYVRFLPGTATGRVKFSFDGSALRDWAALLIATVSGPSHDIQRFALDNSGRGSLYLDNVEQYSEITLVGINILEGSSPSSYSYQAELVGDGAVLTSLNTDTVVFTLYPNRIGLQLTNLGPTPDSFSIFATETAGWDLRVDTAGPVTLASGADTTILIVVTPPEGILPGESAVVSSGSFSLSDTSVRDSTDVLQVVSLQRGDANWNGAITVGDALYLVGVIFNEGPAPMPSALAGDANCSGAVNVADVLTLVNLIFNGGPPPPCNAVDPL